MKMGMSFIGCLLIGLASGLILQSCGMTLEGMNSVELVQYYLAAEVNTVLLQKTTEQVIYELEEIAYPSDHVRIDYLVNDGLQIVYSAGPDTHGLWAVVESMPTLPNTDEALVSALYTLVDIANQNPDRIIRAIVVTNGTSDDIVIDSLFGASEPLALYENVHVAVVGIAPEHRAAFSQGFIPIRDQVLFASTKEEIVALFRAYGG